MKFQELDPAVYYLEHTGLCQQTNSWNQQSKQAWTKLALLASKCLCKEQIKNTDHIKIRAVEDPPQKSRERRAGSHQEKQGNRRHNKTEEKWKKEGRNVKELRQTTCSSGVLPDGQGKEKNPFVFWEVWFPVISHSTKTTGQQMAVWYLSKYIPLQLGIDLGSGIALPCELWNAPQWFFQT